MLLDPAKPKYKESTTWLGMRGRDNCKKVDSQGEHFKGIHDRFLRDPAYRESQLAFGWTEQEYKEWDEFSSKRRPHIPLLFRNSKDTKDNGILLLTKQAKMGL